MTGSAIKILVIEDVGEIADVIEAVLTAASYEVEVVGDGVTGLARALAWLPDVVVLDLTLPEMDGTEVCRRLRESSDAYILMLTARHDEIDRILGLSVGADDYITKPFSPRELVARVQAVLRRPRMATGQGEQPVPAEPTAAQNHDCREFGPLLIDRDAREVSVAGTPVVLTRIEYEILDCLTESPRRVMTRGQVRAHVWGEDWLADDHAVDVHVSNLRRKLTDAGSGGKLIMTVRGVGYRMAPDQN